MSAKAENGGKQFVVDFWFKEWMVDGALRGAGPVVRDRWHDALCQMWLHDTDRRRDTMEGWANVWGCPVAEARETVRVIALRDIGSVTLCHGYVTLRCRRLTRKLKERAQARDRQRAHREERAVSRPCHTGTVISPITTSPVNVKSPSVKRTSLRAREETKGEMKTPREPVKGETTGTNWKRVWSIVVDWFVERKGKAAAEWTNALASKRGTLEAFNPLIVVGHVMDVYHAKSRPRDGRQAAVWVMRRCQKHYTPAHYDDAKRALEGIAS